MSRRWRPGSLTSSAPRCSLPWKMGRRSALRYSSTISPRFWAAPGFIWRTCIGVWQSNFTEAGQHCRPAGLRAAGVVVPGLEQAEHQLLPRPGRRAHGRLDRLPSRRSDAQGFGRSRIAKTIPGLSMAWYCFRYSISFSPYCRSTSRKAAPYRAALIRPTPETSSSASSSCGQRRAISSSVALEKMT